MRTVYPRRSLSAAAALVLLLGLAACGGSVVRGTGDQVIERPPSTSSSIATPTRTPTATTPTPKKTTRASTSTPKLPPKTTSATPPLPGSGPLIVLDPGHSVTVHATDPATGLDVSDYENEPEMTDVYGVAQLVRQRLLADGYRVLMTKSSNGTPTSLGRRAQVANDAHAALAVSIHDQAGGGGIPFATGNNTVYYQSVGNYRETPSGAKVVFTNAAVAAKSKQYGGIFQTARAAKEGHSVTLLGNTGYDLGTRGLPAGNIWIVQLLSKVPWIYCEAGGNSPGRSGLDSGDRQRYAAGIVAGIEKSVPANR